MCVTRNLGIRRVRLITIMNQLSNELLDWFKIKIANGSLIKQTLIDLWYQNNNRPTVFMGLFWRTWMICFRFYFFITGDDGHSSIVIHQNIIFYGIGVVLSVIIIICCFAIKTERWKKIKTFTMLKVMSFEKENLHGSI